MANNLTPQQQNYGKKALKAKAWSKLLMAFTLIFVAATTFKAEESEARKGKAAQGTKARKKRAKRDNSKVPAGVFALYQNSTFGYGKCLPSLEDPTAEILTRNGIETAGATEPERTALAKGIAQVERLLGEPIPTDYRYNYQWIQASGPWNSGISRPGFVTVKRFNGSPKGTLTGRMMHELGHRFGHANGGENYRAYQKHMRGKKCHITTYCGKNLNEEFAEVFEAYVVNPDFLAKYCPDSFAFFKNTLFRNSENILASCEDPDSILTDDNNDDDDDAVEENNEHQIDEDHDFNFPNGVPLPTPRPADLGGNTAKVTVIPVQTTPVAPAVETAKPTMPVTDKVAKPVEAPIKAPVPTARPTTGTGVK